MALPVKRGNRAVVTWHAKKQQKATDEAAVALARCYMGVAGPSAFLNFSLLSGFRNMPGLSSSF
jgi:hypothetical protein